jgi:hypothetical protein
MYPIVTDIIYAHRNLYKESSWYKLLACIIIDMVAEFIVFI